MGELCFLCGSEISVLPERRHLCQAPNVRPANLTRTRSWHLTSRHNRSQTLLIIRRHERHAGFRKSVPANTAPEKGRRSNGGQQSRYFAPGPWPCSSPMVCSYDSACKYLGGFANWGNRSPSVQPSERNVSKQARDVAGSLRNAWEEESRRQKQRHCFFFLPLCEQRHLCLLGLCG